MVKKEIKRVVRFASALVILVMLAFALYGITNLGPMNEEALTLINKYGTPALFAISIFLDLIPQMISPIIALGVGLLAGINIYYAILATVLGSIIGSIIGFAIGKKYLFNAVDVLTSKKSTERIIHLTNKYGKVIIPIAAISPLPYLPIALGAMNLSKRNFIIYGLIPRAFGIAAYGFLFNIF